MAEVVPDVSERIATIDAEIALIDDKLMQQVCAHDEKLVAQASSVECMGDMVGSVRLQMTASRAAAAGLAGQARRLHEAMAKQTGQLANMHKACTLLRHVHRFLQLTAKLKNSAAYPYLSLGVGTADHHAPSTRLSPRDMLKCSTILRELAELSGRDGVGAVAVLQQYLAELPRQQSALCGLARHALGVALAAANAPNVACLIQVLLHVGGLQAQVRLMMQETHEQVDSLLSELANASVMHRVGTTAGLRADASTASLHQHQGQPNPTQSTAGGGSAANLGAAVRANAWSSAGTLSAALAAAAANVHGLKIGLRAMMEGEGGLEYKSEIEDTLSNVNSSWHALLAHVEKQLSEGIPISVRQCFENEYPRLLRLLLDALRSHDVLDEEKQTTDSTAATLLASDLRGTTTGLQRAYARRCAARLEDLLQQCADAAGASTPGNGATVDAGRKGRGGWHRVHAALRDQLAVTGCDEALLDEVGHNIVKAVDFLSAKSETLPEIDDRFADWADIVNCVYNISQLGDTVSSATTSAVVVDAMQLATHVVRARLRLISEWAERDLELIILSAHDQQHNAPHATTTDKPSAYVVLDCPQDSTCGKIAGRLGAVKCGHLSAQCGTDLAGTAAHLFALSVSAGRRLRPPLNVAQVLKDCEHVKSALVKLCLDGRHPHEFATLEQLSLCLTRPLDELVSSEAVGATLPYSLAVQLLMTSSQAIPLPNEPLQWTIAQYVRWQLHDARSEPDRLQVLRAALQAYERQVAAAEEETAYCESYPVMVKLMQRAAKVFESES